MQIEDYQKAGKIAGEVREMVRVKIGLVKQSMRFVKKLNQRFKNGEPNVHFQ